MHDTNIGIRPYCPNLKVIICLAVNILVLSSLITVPAYAELATKVEMDAVAENWVTYIIAQKGDWAGVTTLHISNAQALIANDTVLAYCYSLSSGGYIVVPTLKELPPVQAYSTESDIDANDDGGTVQMFRDLLQHRFRLFVQLYGRLEDMQPVVQPLFNPKNRANWDNLAVDPASYRVNPDKSVAEPMAGVGPLLNTTWHQGSPYNAYCPQGDGGRCVVGCVSTAASQIAWYHQWPNAGQGTYSYYWTGDNSCGHSTSGQTLQVDLSDPYEYAPTNSNVAELSYEMGVAYNMDYGACASGAYLSRSIEVFRDLYRYDPSIDLEYHSNHSADSWFNLIKLEINQGRPILYGIYSHAIVCDGWQETGVFQQYHFNYGWGGSQNGWYTLDQLYCPWSGCGLDAEMMVRRIIPMTGIPYLGGNQFSDAAFGDNDGVPEAGERIVLTFKISNYGAAPITDVFATLALDDATINVNDGSSVIGSIPAKDSASNSLDPMEFSIPADYAARVDSFIIFLSWNGNRLDTMVIEKALGRASILLVDDDENDNVNSYYEECFNHLRIPANIWIHSAYASPDSAYLSQYDVVFWFTGDYRTSPLNTSEITAMKGYLNQGGNLFLSGQRIAAQLNSLDPSFLSDYLKATYASTSFMPILTADPGSDIFRSSDSVQIQSQPGASNQTNPDHIMPTAGGTGAFHYYGLPGYGGVSHNGSYKSVFFSFGAEAITNAPGRWTMRDSIISEILDYFDYQKPHGAPVVHTFVVGPGDQQHLTDHVPTISWGIADPNQLTQIAYQLQVDSDSDWTSVSVWDPGITSSGNSEVVFGGSELSDGATYYARVRVYDGIFWSGWQYLHMRLNSTTCPSNATPVSMTAVASATPILTVDNPYDPEADILFFGFEVFDDSLLTIPVAQASGIQRGPYTKTSWQPPVPLTDDEDYYWRACVLDGFENGAWSPASSFWVNSDNHPPAIFALNSPDNNASVIDVMPELTWANSIDSDRFDKIRYTVYLSMDPNFGISLIAATSDSSKYTVGFPLTLGNTYYWKVVAKDELDAATDCSSTHQFTIGYRGDANADMSVNVADAVFLINHVFKSGPAPSPSLLGDPNCDSSVNVGDAVFLINLVFKSGPPPGCQ